MIKSQHTELVMGTALVIDVVHDPSRESAVVQVTATVVELLRSIDERFSTYETDSEVSRYGRGELSLDEISSDLQMILSMAESFRLSTNGYFDIHAAARSEPAATVQYSGVETARAIEPSGVVKGWAVSEAARLLHADGFENFSINLGGDLFLAGKDVSGDAWRIGLQHPFEKMKVMAVLAVSDTAIATSGSYERGAHIVDPVGSATSDLLSVTIVGPDPVMADVYATAAYAMGLQGVQWAAELQGFEVFAVDGTQTTHHSPGLKQYLIS